MNIMRHHKPIGVTAALLAMAVGALVAQQPATYDLVIRNGRIVDGTGGPWFRADLAVRGDTIVRIAPQIAGTARRTIDVHGQIVSPGFIDIHTHARRGIFEVLTADNYLRQGVTTLIEGPDGSSPIPLKPFLERVAATPVTRVL
jgi:N-acyl-D-aspartate/D-glutamate deacylase